MAVTRIDAGKAHADLESGALLVCAYDEPAKWTKYRLDGAISLQELQQREQSLGKKHPLIFYCA